MLHAEETIEEEEHIVQTVYHLSLLNWRSKIARCANTGTICRYLRCQHFEKDRQCWRKEYQILAWMLLAHPFSSREMRSIHSLFFTFPWSPPPSLPSKVLLSKYSLSSDIQLTKITNLFTSMSSSLGHTTNTSISQIFGGNASKTRWILPLHFVPWIHIFRKDAEHNHDWFSLGNYGI